MRGRAQERGYSRPISDLLLTPWIVIPVSVLIGIFLAGQFVHLTPRYVKLLFGMAVLLLVLRLPLSLSTTVFLVIFPVPTFVFLGDTDVIFIGLMMVVWIGSVVLRRHPRPVRTPIDWAILLYLGAHVLSFINLPDKDALMGALSNMAFLTAGVLLYVLLVNSLRTEAHLRRALLALCVTAIFVDVTAVVEYYRGIRLIPEWFIYAPAVVGQVTVGGRAGGVFGSHPLLADFSAILFYLEVVFAMRSRRILAKLLFYFLALMSLEMLFITANRGGAIIWAIGGVYFLWVMKRHINWMRVALSVPFVIAGGGAAILLTRRWFASALLLSRLIQTQLNRGIPEDRVLVWTTIVKKIPEHLWIGHGPFLSGLGSGAFWPHSAYLFYFYTVGLLGLLIFIRILFRVIAKSRPPREGIHFGRDPFPKVSQGLFHIMVVMFAIGQIRDEHQRGNVFVYFMWILFALAMVSTRIARAQETEARIAGETPADPGEATVRDGFGR